MCCFDLNAGISFYNNALARKFERDDVSTRLCVIRAYAYKHTLMHMNMHAKLN